VTINGYDVKYWKSAPRRQSESSVDDLEGYR